MPDGAVVECKNICSTPALGFDVSDADLHIYIDDAVGTWHTHPFSSNQLSIGDFDTYRGLPTLTHFILGQDGLAAYQADRDAIIILELPA
jgi:hypothetical protein